MDPEQSCAVSLLPLPAPAAQSTGEQRVTPELGVLGPAPLQQAEGSMELWPKGSSCLFIAVTSKGSLSRYSAELGKREPWLCCQAGESWKPRQVCASQEAEWCHESFKVPGAALTRSANLHWEGRNVGVQGQLRSPVVTPGGWEERGRGKWITGQSKAREGLSGLSPLSSRESVLRARLQNHKGQATFPSFTP